MDKYTRVYAAHDSRPMIALHPHVSLKAPDTISNNSKYMFVNIKSYFVMNNGELFVVYKTLFETAPSIET